MKSLYLLAILLGVGQLNAQSSLGTFNFYSNTPDTCGSGMEINRPEHFIAYQTLDNTQDGAIDPTTCVDWSNQGLVLEGADLSRPVFIRLVDFELQLPPNRLIQFYLDAISLQASNLDIDIGNQDYCFDGLCSGLEVEIQIPNEEGDGFDTRKWQQEFSVQPFDEEDFYNETGMWLESDFGFCVPTEAFEVQELQDVVFKFMIEPGTSILYLGVFRISSEQLIQNIDNSNVSNYLNQSGYEFTYNGNESSEDYIFRFDQGGYPSDNNRSYIEFEPFENPNEEQLINLFFDQYSTFTADPHTYLRGTLVEGEDSIRHSLSIINDGAVFCFNSYYDVIIQEGWSYTHRSGILDLQGGRACMQLNEGGKMIVEDDYLHYGKVGQGMYALYGGSSILLEENAHLYFDGKLLLANHQWDDEFIPVVMTLEQGAKLSFSEFAKLDNLTLDGQTKLLIYNRGGVIDLTNLSEQERASIEIVEEAVVTKHITLLGNPVQENGMLDFMLFEDGPATIRVIDFNGKQVIEQELDSHTPLTHLDLDGLSAGTYLLKVKQQAEVRTERFVIN